MAEQLINYRLRLISPLPPEYELMISYGNKQHLSCHSREEVLLWIQNLRSDNEIVEIGAGTAIKGLSLYRSRLAEYFGLVVQE